MYRRERRLHALILLVLSISGGALRATNETGAFQVERRRVDYSDGFVRKYVVQLYPPQGPKEPAFEQDLEFDSRTLRVHLTVEADSADSPWFVELRYPDGTVAWKSTEDDRRGRSFWSGEVDGGSAELFLQFTGRNRNAKVRLDSVAVTGIESKPQSITTRYEDMVPILSLPDELQALGKSTARLRFIGDDGGRYVCTGFLVSPDLMMTNEHCFSSSDEALSALVDFDVNTVNSSCAVRAATDAGCKTVRVSKFLWSNFALDYALARLATVPEGRNAVPLAAASSLLLGEDLIVIQHPDGQAKKVSLINCQVSNKEFVQGRAGETHDISHLCNTVGGSSGSAVWDRKSRHVIGIHHFGFSRGAVKPSNQAVDMGFILDDIFAHDPTVYSSLNIVNPTHPKH